MARVSRWLPPDDLIGCFVAYNFWELGAQPLFGLLLDWVYRPRLMALVGLAVLAGGLLLPSDAPWAAMTLSGVGNTLFHVGMGVVAMRATPFSAAGPGLFIAPGAIGVALARGFGRGLEFPLWPVLLLLVFAALLSLAAPDRGKTTQPATEPVRGPGLVLGAVGLLMLAIGLRSFVGLRVGAAFGAHAAWVLPLAVATLLGKGLGGVVADRAGFRATAIASLSGAALLFVLAGEHLVLALAAVLLFQALTGVTLAALWRLMPSRPGLAFGLNCTALFVGSVPIVARTGPPPSLELDAVLALGAAAAIAVALSLRPATARTASAG